VAAEALRGGEGKSSKVEKKLKIYVVWHKSDNEADNLSQRMVREEAKKKGAGRWNASNRVAKEKIREREWLGEPGMQSTIE